MSAPSRYMGISNALQDACVKKLAAASKALFTCLHQPRCEAVLACALERCPGAHVRALAHAANALAWHPWKAMHPQTTAWQQVCMHPAPASLPLLSRSEPIVGIRDANLNLKRNPNLKPEMQALGVDVAKRLEILRVEEPPKRRSGVRVASVAELVDKLHNEAKVV